MMKFGPMKIGSARMPNIPLGKLESEDYMARPYASRSEYIELLMTIVQSPELADALDIRNRDPTAMDIIYRSMDKENAEYLLNGSRRLRIALMSGNLGGPVGTCGNEAMARGLKRRGGIYHIRAG